MGCHQMMFVLIWMLFALTGAESPVKNCKATISVSGTERNITAQAGHDVVLLCSVEGANDVKSIEWCKFDQQDKCSKIIHSPKDQKEIQSEVKGRVSLLDSDLKKRNCSIIITNLTTSDSGLYKVRVNSCTDEANITVTVLNRTATATTPPLTAGQQTTLTNTDLASSSGHQTKIPGFVSAVTDRYNSTKITGLKISGDPMVMEGDNLTLTCTVDGFPATSIKWTKSGSDKSLYEARRNERNESIGPAYLIIHNVTADHSGQYICTATNHNTTKTARTDINVKFVPKILNESSCHSQSEVRTCVCVSEGFPLPSITWPVLEGHTSYSVLTNVSKSRVTSTLTVSMMGQDTPSVLCVSNNDVGAANKTIAYEKRDLNILQRLRKTLKELESYFLLLIGFVFGVILTAAIACCAVKCHRKKRLRNCYEDLEMVSTQTTLKVEVEYDCIPNQVTAEAGAESAAQAAPNGDVELKETEYSDLDFSAMKHRNPPEAQETQETRETEYAEIKKEGLRESQPNGGEEGEILEINDEEVVMMTENETPKENVLAEEAMIGEDVPLYSDVNDVISET